MSRRRRLSPPWLPGFWPMVAVLVLLAGSVGFFYALGKLTSFERKPSDASQGTASR